ncbi:hypothetical protein QN363_17360, partial [Undibacterium sp. CCC2.1]|uniref:hypothetical protein n=1 Tax=unclassified Undibacterium TaxID=2630295 RepID=UPI002B237A25
KTSIRLLRQPLKAGVSNPSQIFDEKSILIQIETKGNTRNGLPVRHALKVLEAWFRCAITCWESVISSPSQDSDVAVGMPCFGMTQYNSLLRIGLY